ncbi:MAG: ISKra4 family transposase [Armatimonadetes bacterium]|nr:ISKra4 family transposase [Armatimonadota bacterium]
MVPREQMQDLLDGFRAWCKEHLSVNSVQEAEEMAVTIGRQVAQVVVEEGVEQISHRASYEGCSIACSCGRRAKFIDYRPKYLMTLAGTVKVLRSYYYCRGCKTGHIPWDARQGVTGLQWTPAVKALAGHFIGRVTYQEMCELVELTTGLHMVESCAEKVSYELGPKLREQEREQIAAVFDGEVLPLVAQAPRRVYVAVDGTHAHIDGQWHEIKAGVIYRGEPDAEGNDEAIHSYYVAAQEPAEQFAERMYAAAVFQGVEQAQEQVVIGDGAEWIWNLAAHHFPDATQIVDYWHACEHIWTLRRALYAQDSAAGDRWAREHCRKLRDTGPRSLLRSLRRMKASTPEAAAVIRTETGYFTRHRKRMAYPQFRARGMMIGSGPVEAACKVVIGHRMKRAGMRWTRSGADAVLAIRCALLNGDYDRLNKAARAA